MRYLFYIVHPSKFHLFRFTINELKKNNTVDIVINSKDVLEDLIVKEGWSYFNIFPDGRNKSDKPSIIKSGIKFLLTLWRLEKFLFRQKKYDLFITDDSLVVNGFFRRKMSYFFCDNDIKTIKINKILFYFASKIITPESTDLGKFSYKQIPFKGNKAIAHLHPDYFKPSNNTLEKYNLIETQYCIIRLSLLNATHDIRDNKGITDQNLKNILDFIGNKYKVVILSERDTPNYIKDMLYNGNPSDIKDLLFFSKFIISDSGTMATEAAILGTPNILINKLAEDIGVHQELKKEKLQLYFNSFSDSIDSINMFINSNTLTQDWKRNKKRYIEKCDDLNKLLVENFTKGEL